MKVKAVKVGFYGKLRSIGEEFTISDKKALGSWMKQVEVKNAVVKETAKKD